VNRLKLMKRSMYGRAKLPLLRQRVLHDPKGTKDRKGKKSQIQIPVKKSDAFAPTSKQLDIKCVSHLRTDPEKREMLRPERTFL
jgi:hypothetical protein